ncbi:MAG: Na/Pi cotransporter family protein [Sedimentisphaerales bacterium]|nr:Na/Pi cotransporter family protein [Sedimentisphaerales bacterium]
MIQEMIFGVAGGLGMFLFGMIQMSEGLKKAAGRKLRGILESMTRNRVTGCLVGAGITALIQSSSAATVMVVGFVNAGLLTLKQAISVIIGTNIGTTATAWLVSISGFEFKITNYALPAVAIGFGLQIFGKTRTAKNIGEIVLGFGILFIGIDFMKGGFDGLEKSPRTQEVFVKAAGTPILALMAGLIITTLIQSSSAAVASIQLLAWSGAFGTNWDMALTASIPFILGSNIGTTVTAQLAAFRANLNARRAAWAHTTFNIIGALICVWLIGWIARLVRVIAPWELTEETIMPSIAIAHTTIKTFEAVFFLPLTGLLEKTVVRIVPEKPGDLLARPMVLERHLLATPELAVEQARREIVRMAQVAKRAVMRAIEGLVDDDRRKLDIARTMEDITDSLQYEITSYLAALSEREISGEMSAELPVLMHTINDLERIGDHAENIVEIAERKIEQKLPFSDSAVSEAGELRKEAEQMCDYIIGALKNNDVEAAKSALVCENKFNKMQIDLRRSHVQRMTEGACTADTGLIFIDLVDNVEKIGDHLTNIAQAVIGGLQWDGAEFRVVAGAGKDVDDA